MGRSQAEKAASRERILKRAAEQIRADGFDAVSVAKLMRSVNLTHGGFYGHFASRSDLLVQALERALEDGFASARLTTAWAEPLEFATIVRTYVSGAHRDARTTGCAIAALAADVVHADDRSREVMSEYIERFIANIERTTGAGDEAGAMFAASAMIGGLLLSRVIVDKGRSNALLKTVREHLIGTADPTMAD